VKVAETLPEHPVDAPTVPADLRKSVEVPAPGEATPAPGAVDEIVKPAPTDDKAKPAAAPSRRKSVDQPLKHTGQVAVFVSRKEKRIFVRQGMVPIFDMPVTIDELDRPLGLHVFTALGPTEDGSGMRWNLMTVPTDGTIYEDWRRMSRRRGREPVAMPAIPAKSPSTAAQALERIEMPKEAVDRIGELLMPGSSLVISDDGLGRETGRMTEFIVLTH